MPDTRCDKALCKGTALFEVWGGGMTLQQLLEQRRKMVIPHNVDFGERCLCESCKNYVNSVKVDYWGALERARKERVA